MNKLLAIVLTASALLIPLASEARTPEVRIDFPLPPLLIPTPIGFVHAQPFHGAGYHNGYYAPRVHGGHFYRHHGYHRDHDFHHGGDRGRDRGGDQRSHRR